MRVMIFLVLALALLGGGAFGAYQFFNAPAEAATAKAEKPKKKSEGPPALVELDPLYLPLVGEKGVSQMISIVVSLEVENASTAEKLKHFTPRLTDAYIRDMYGTLSQKAAISGGVVQVGIIKQRLTKVTENMLGEGVVSDVLLQHVQQTKIN